MATDFQTTLDSIDRGREGLNKGLSMGLDKLMQIIPGVQQKTYYLVGAESGIGKSAFVLNSFLFNPYSLLKVDNEEELSMKVFYYSLEIDKVSIISKAIARKLFFRHGYLTTTDDILSRGKHRISQELYDDVKNARVFFEDMEDVFTIYPPVNSTGIYKDVKTYMESVGKTHMKTVNNGKEDIEIFDYYEPNNPKETVLVIVDHMSILPRQLNYNVKENIDSMSNYFVTLRNRYNVSPVAVQQLNRAMSSADRFKLKRTSPQLSDFKDSGNTIQDSNVVISLHSPHRIDQEEYNGYDITELKNRFVWAEVLKNRDGVSDMGIGLNFIGEIGLFKELPAPDILKLSGYSPYVDFNYKTCLREDDGT